MDNTFEEFQKYHETNPQVYEMFKRFAFELINSNVKSTGVRLVIERIRWETTIQTEGDAFKLNNNWSPYYSRMFMKDYPQHKGFFRVRKQHKGRDDLFGY